MQTVEKQSPNVIVSPGQNKQSRFTCICCRIKFGTAELQRVHFKTEWHCYNLKRRICTLEPIDLDEFNQIQANTALDAASDETSTFDASSYVDLGASDPESASSDSNQIIDDEWVEIDDDVQFLDEDYDDDEIDDMLSKMVKSNTCLFCDKKSITLKANVEHMSSSHGFFVPEEKYLIDLEGLMDYLGFKVGAGATCLWCDKQFTSLHGVRLHMLYKDHCKIFYNQERAIEEFKDFYDYSKQEQIPMKSLNELDLPKRRADRYHDHNRSCELAKPLDSNRELTSDEKAMLARQASAIKKFSSQRARNVLKVGVMNNKTARGRMRHQNPI